MPQGDKPEIQNFSLKALKLTLLDPNKAKWLGIIDANRHEGKQAILRWELVESGSIIGALNAYSQMVEDIDQELSIDVINNIRAASWIKDMFGNQAIRSSAAYLNKIGEESFVGVHTFTTGPDFNYKDITRLNREAEDIKKQTDLNEK